MILVTGATGTVGCHVVRELQARGASVRALVEAGIAPPQELSPTVTVVRGDYDDRASLERAMAGVERVFLLTPPDPRQVGWQRNAIETAAATGVRHMVKLSAYRSTPDSPFAISRWHAEGEALLRSSGMAYTFLQPQYFMQNLLRQATAVREEGVVRGIGGEAAIGMVDARDIAAVAAVAILTDEQFGKTLVPTGPEAVSYPAATALLGRLLGKPIEYVERAPDVLLRQMRERGAEEWLVESLVGLTRILTPEVTEDVRQVTDRAPRTMQQFLEDHLEAFGGRR